MADIPNLTTGLLNALSAGDQAAGEKLMPLVYDALHGIASAYLRRERVGHTLQPTALVNEVYIRLLGEGRIDWKNRAHFLAYASVAMRNVLVNHALARQAAKRGGGVAPLTLEIEPAADQPRLLDVVALHEALTKLAALDSRKAKVVECRFFGGMTAEETAHVLECSLSTIEADWRMARAWLSSELSPRG